MFALGLRLAFAQGPGPQVSIVELEMGNNVEVMRAGNGIWDRAYTNQVLRPGDWIRTGPRSRATLRLSDQSLFRLGELSDLEIQPPPEPKGQATFSLIKGLLYFWHSEKTAGFRVKSRTASAAIRGTEFNLEVTEEGRTILTLLDGEVELSNDQGPILLRSGEQGIAEPGRRPTKTAVLEPSTIIQWCLYYPGVLNLDELPLADSVRQDLSKSLGAYQSGDLLEALGSYPAGRQPGSASEKAYLSALLLAVGQVDAAEGLLRSARETAGVEDKVAALAASIQKLISAVKGQTDPSPASPELANSLLAESYYLQSRSNREDALSEALRVAHQAVERAPNFGFAWARLAELEFSFGRTPQAEMAVEKSLQLSPRNAQALALKGFLLSARNKIPEGIVSFQAAMAVDGALGNAWLGRGLCRIRQGQAEAGLEDLQVAAALEPRRALLRDYVAKAYSQIGDRSRARKEIDLAKRLDANDPTAWLYSALFNQRSNRANEAVRDLEKSQELNNNRRLYRSTFLLDQDRAVGSVNLASIYRDAGMFDISVHEAARAANSDYGNYSAHLFLANSYSALRDPNLVNLRYETATFSEYLLANLLAPVGGSALSTYVSQQEYARLFDSDGIHFSSGTTYFSRGSWEEDAAIYGRARNTGYAADLVYRSDNGQRANNDLQQITVAPLFKQQITPQDSIYFQAIYNDFESGDVRQYYDPTKSSQGLRVKERQEPNIFAGYHHEWGPGSHTLFLFGHLDDSLKITEPAATVSVFFQNTNGQFIGIPLDASFDLGYRSKFGAYSAELQQILQVARHTVIAGGRYQTGETKTDSTLLRDPSAFPPLFGTNAVPAAQAFTTDLERISFYGYEQWRVWDPLLLIAGLTYDHLQYPRNINLPPLSPEQKETDQVSPKAGLIWTPWKNTAFRAAYTRSLGGLFYDTSVRLEPAQIAGFNQAFRSLIPESVEGAVPGSKFETFGIGGEQKFGWGTYLALEANLLRSKADRLHGAFERVQIFPFPPATPAQIQEQLKFEERSLAFSLNQLVERDLALGARYQVSRAELKARLPEIPVSVTPDADRDERALLHQLSLFAIYNHPSGFFSQFQSLWNAQHNEGYSTPLPGDNFWQFNLFAGYRLPGRLAELTVGLLNIGDRDYHLNPLNLYYELPRHRTLALNLKFYF